MKQFFVTLAVTALCTTQVALASNTRSYSSHRQVYQNRTVHDPVPASNKGDKVNARIQASFKREFAGASLLKWERLKSNICQAYFIYNSERYNAFFDVDGELVATSRFIRESGLPMLIRNTISRKYASYQLSQVIELTRNNETTYLLTFDNEQEKREVQVYGNGGDYLIKREKKNFAAKL